MLESHSGSSVVEVIVALSLFSLVIFGFAKGMQKATLQLSYLHQTVANLYDEKN